MATSHSTREAEGQGSWANMVHCFEQSSMRESVFNMIHAVGINTEQNNQFFFFFNWPEGSRITKRGF